ncbi:hypothetical protein BHE90_010878 [Fusarium euwallaceae]|uniref:Uncharacterized protein n=1 Tax=Fusarium euwallaceae TaxID=1147111 RepID=A0A430LG71_9HYPO|nr:hypothetical protein BHE90_010878 [Fusarium euwallaceae]
MRHFKLTSDFATDAGSTRSHSDLQAQTPPDTKHGKTRDPTNLPSHPIATVRPAHGTRSSYVSRAVLANWRKVQEIHGDAIFYNTYLHLFTIFTKSLIIFVCRSDVLHRGYASRQLRYYVKPEARGES